MSPLPPPEVAGYTYKQAADCLQWSVRHVKRCVSRYGLPKFYVRDGRNFRVVAMILPETYQHLLALRRRARDVPFYLSVPPGLDPDKV